MAKNVTDKFFFLKYFTIRILIRKYLVVFISLFNGIIERRIYKLSTTMFIFIPCCSKNYSFIKNFYTYSHKIKIEVRILTILSLCNFIVYFKHPITIFLQQNTIIRNIFSFYVILFNERFFLLIPQFKYFSKSSHDFKRHEKYIVLISVLNFYTELYFISFRILSIPYQL